MLAEWFGLNKSAYQDELDAYRARERRQKLRELQAIAATESGEPVPRRVASARRAAELCKVSIWG